MDKDFDINESDVDNFKIENKKLRIITIFCLIMSVIITVIHNTNLNLYIRDIIIPFSMMIGGFIFLVYKNKLKINKKAYILLIPIILILLSDIIIGIDISNKVLNVFVLPILISIFFFSLVNKNYKITKESIAWILKLFPKGIFGNLKYIKKTFASLNRPKTKIILNIFLGLIIGLPIAFVLLNLLANADKYFSEFIGFILNFITKIFNNNEIILNLIIIIVSFIIFFSIFINILKNKNIKLKDTKYHKWNNVIVSTILIIINLIFTLFLISEISRLTVNFLQLPIEYTYAEYAREGFFQLLTVTTINFAIILYNIYYTKIINDNSFIKKLILILIAFSIILIFNSYYRMFLYIGAYGFTVLRLQVTLFLAMELILFLILIKKIVSKIKSDEIIFTTIIIVFYILNIYLCTNNFIKLFK